MTPGMRAVIAIRKRNGETIQDHELANLIDHETGAPELLGALKKAHYELNALRARCGVPWWDTGRSDVNADYFSEVVDECEAAISKAEGKL